MVGTEVLTSEGHIDLGLNRVAFQNVPIRSKRVTHVPHEVHDRLVGPREGDHLFGFPRVAVPSRRHADGERQIVVREHRDELIEV